MIRNYIKSAIRNLSKRRGYSLLNVFGLAIGITCCLLILKYVAFERSYDKFEPEAGRIYRLRLDSYQQGKLSWQSATAYPGFGPTLKKDFPEVEEFCRLYDAEWLLSNDQRHLSFSTESGYCADASFLDMFGVNVISGDRNTALDGPNKIMLSEEEARKFFGAENPVGKQLTYRNPQYVLHLEVTGVFKALPANSHLVVNHLVSYSTINTINRIFGDSSNQAETSFDWYDFYTYLKLKPGVSPADLESKFPAFCDKYINDREWNKTNNVKSAISLIALPDIYLYSKANQEAEVNGNGEAVSFLFLIAVFIIAIAWINYINLATARSLERAREVGVRKVVGALRKNLIFQFLTESLMLNIAALFIAALLVWILSPWFSRLSGVDAVNRFGLPATYAWGFLLVFFAGTIVSGIYPAFVLSSFRPVAVLKGKFSHGSRGQLMRKGLIIMQFVTSVVLIAGTIVVVQQVKFMRNQKLGADISRTIVLRGGESLVDSVYSDVFQPFKNELLQNAGIQAVSASTSVMGKEIYWTNSNRNRKAGSQTVTLYNMGVDYDFIPAFDLQLLAGRNFSPEFKTDENAAILNENAASLLGFGSPEEAVNDFVIRGRDTMKVIGVVSNYHHLGLQKSIDPMIVLLRPNTRNYYSIKLKSDNLRASVAAIGNTWNKYFPNDPFNYFFLDETFNQQYKADTRFGEVFGLFAFLAILIACFGLLGLSAYNILQRTKEIGIRKVLGAPFRNIIYLLSRDFMVLIGIAFLLAIPFTWWVMNSWLEDFAYRIHIHWWVFAAAGGIAVLVAMLTISVQAVKAAHVNPVRSLRSE